MVLEKTLENPLNCKKIKLVNPKGNQSGISLKGLMQKLKIQYLNHLMERSDSLEKILMLEIYGMQEEKGTTEDEMVVWHHRLSGHEFEQASSVGDGQGSLACFSAQDCKESQMTERLN